jgi:hypothetical protein
MLWTGFICVRIGSISGALLWSRCVNEISGYEKPGMLTSWVRISFLRKLTLTGDGQEYWIWLIAQETASRHQPYFSALHWQWIQRNVSLTSVQTMPLHLLRIGNSLLQGKKVKLRNRATYRGDYSLHSCSGMIGSNLDPDIGHPD